MLVLIIISLQLSFPKPSNANSDLAEVAKDIMHKSGKSSLFIGSNGVINLISLWLGW